MSPPQNRTVGLIGIGLVGTALAELLIRAGYQLVGYDLSEEARRRLETLGGEAASSSAEVAQKALRLVLSLPDSEAVRMALLGPDGALQGKVSVRYVLDTTTGDPEITEAIAEECSRRGVGFLDATISGSSRQVREKTAVLMVGAEPQALEACRDLLEAISNRTIHLGPPGSGAKAKLATNLMLGLNRLVLAEGLLFAEALGLDPGAFLDLVRQTPAYSAAVDSKGQKMIQGDFSPESRVRQHRKDVELILRHAKKRGLILPLTRLHAEVLDALIAGGMGDWDNAAVILALRGWRSEPEAQQTPPSREE
ncbi:MAG: 2-hydroxy-3-oxopropionate reductase [Candidatus Poribacteria bacterium]|nr:MAG: 2-hydroxy-3-oxopropionate reductase [Candidatus Poribacteria bacterium]